MKKNLILAGIVILALIAGVFTYSRKPVQTGKPEAELNPGLTSPQPENSAAGITGKKTYTLDEITLHNNKEDCWFAIDDKVYNVTEYIAGGKHGGGDAIIAGCGKDATELFNTRPMGSGTPHSDKARDFLTSYEIGSLTI